MITSKMMCVLADEVETKPSVPMHQQTPPKDPVSSTSADTPSNKKQSANRASQFIVDDALSDRPVVGVVC